RHAARRRCERDLPNSVDNSGSRNIEIGNGSVKLQIVPGKAIDRVGEGIAEQGRRTGVDTIATCKRALDLVTAMQVPGDTNLHSVISGVSVPKQTPELAIVWVHLSSTAGRRGPNIAGWRSGWKHQVEVVGTEWLMDTSRSNVSHHDSKIFRQVPLNIEAPLHDVIAVRTGLDICLRQRGHPEQLTSPGRETAGR